MAFLRQILTGRFSRGGRERVSEQAAASPRPASPASHALDTLTALPKPRRPITPTSPHIQLQSPFFRLPPELRLQIYRLVLSGREIHIDMRYTAVETTTPHSTRGASFETRRRWRWRASICHRHPDAQPISDRCGWGGPPPTACRLFGTPCAVAREVLGLLLSCRLAYREAVGVLYGENTFHVATGALLLYTDRLLPPERAAAVTSLIVQVTEESVYDYAAEHLGIEPGLRAYEALLLRLPRAFPSLARLLVVIQGSLERGRAGMNGWLSPLDRDAMRDCLLSSMDAAVGGFRKPLVEGVLAMRYTAFDRLMEGKKDAAKTECREGVWLQMWRAVTVTRKEETLDTGYWIRRVSPEETNGLNLQLNFEYSAWTVPSWTDYVS
ncbi:hypothetical protein N657DRAFT_647522 [Parathielavia appendiculata]|uniref:DUF7730 domain-containing protein n=1 Tax=Parathielavia appendiculata TaxID=2587402 RepID=A0AAN6Z2V1_9PEZI|nr:hypothetical protein N657DRAFT_647522 [Parathielavia appendiculata]